MQLVPFEKIKLHSNLSKDELLTKLDENLLPPSINAGNSLFYTGFVNGDGFKVSKMSGDIAKGRQPQSVLEFDGVISKVSNGSEIAVNFRLNRGLLLGFSVASIIAGIFFMYKLQSGTTMEIMPLVYIALLLLFYSFKTYMFNSHMRNSVEDLQRLFEADVRV